MRVESVESYLPGPISMQNMFPLLPVTPKRPELPYGAKKKNGRKSGFFVFSPIGPLNQRGWFMYS